MKRAIMTVLIGLLAAAAFAAGTSEQVNEITVLWSPGVPFRTGETMLSYATEKLQDDFPGVKVTELHLDLSDGSTLTMDALLAAGTPPNVYVDYIGRVSKYLRPEYALPLNDYVRDLDTYRDLGPYSAGGQVLGLPCPGGAQGMAVNLDIMREIGFEPSFDWTIDDFLEMAELVKQHYGGTKWATGMFAGNQSGDYLINNWFPAFGAQWYADGYDHTTIAETGGARFYEFAQMMVREGYFPPGAATLVDDDYVIQWAAGDLAATAFFPGWVEPYFKTVVAQGLIDEPFDYMFLPFPSATDRGTPTYVSSGAIVVRKTGTVADAIAARLVEYMNDAYSQEQQTLQGGVIPSRTDARSLDMSDDIQETARIVEQNGLFDVGLTQPFFARTRPQHFPVLQDVLNLKVTPEEGIAEYARRLNEALQE